MSRRVTGIRKVGDSWEVYGRVGGKQFARRFPLDTPNSVLRTWRVQRINDLRDEQPRHEAGSLGELVERFLRTETGRRQEDFEDLLGHWVKEYAGKGRALITSTMIQNALDRWRVAGVAASTVNHRRRALSRLFTRLEPNLPNPVKGTKRMEEPEPEARAIPDAVFEAIMAKMPECATKARLRIVYEVGVRQSELMRVTVDHLHLDEAPAWVFVHSGKKGNNRVVPLTTRAVAAFRFLVDHAGLGPFDTASMRKTWLVAALKAGHARRDQATEKTEYWHNILCEYRPYDCRHRFATRLRERGTDLADIQALLGHKLIKTTMRYAPTVNARLVTAVQTLEPTNEPT